MSASQMMVRADTSRPARMLARIAVALSVSALGRSRVRSDSQPLRKMGAASDRLVNGRHGHETSQQRWPGDSPLPRRSQEKSSDTVVTTTRVTISESRFLLQPALVDRQTVPFGPFGFVCDEGKGANGRFHQLDDLLLGGFTRIVLNQHVGRDDTDGSRTYRGHLAKPLLQFVESVGQVSKRTAPDSHAPRQAVQDFALQQWRLLIPEHRSPEPVWYLP